MRIVSASGLEVIKKIVKSRSLSKEDDNIIHLEVKSS